MKEFDLSTLKLADGDYEITVVAKAKASGYKASEPSNAVSYVVGSEETITDLTGYTWVGNTTLLDFPLQYATYNLNFTSNNEQFTQIGTANNEDSTQEFSLIYANSTTTKYIYDFEYTSSYYSEMEAYKTIQITGGTDATNSTLIAWLQTNGTLTKTVVEETYTITAGTYVFKENPDTSVIIDNYNEQFYFKTSNVPDTYYNTYSAISIGRYMSESLPKTIIYSSNIDPDEDFYAYENGSWQLYDGYDVRTIIVEEAQTVSQEFYEWFVENTLITFTIEGTTYQAETGMTWAEWVDSEYNTGGFFIKNNLVLYDVVTHISGETATNTIVANKVYKLAHSGGTGN